MSFSFDVKSQMNFETCYKYKIVVLGDTSVGKTSIINKLIYDKYYEDGQPTIGIDFVSKQFLVDEKVIKFQLWDTAGQERFRSLIPCYIRDCSVAIIVFDITNSKSFLGVQKWIDEVRDIRNNEALIFLAGNKQDLGDKREVSQEQAESFGIFYQEVSAKTGEGIQELFEQITKQLQISEKLTFEYQEKEQKNEQTRIAGRLAQNKKCC